MEGRETSHSHKHTGSVRKKFEERPAHIGKAERRLYAISSEMSTGK